MSSVISGKKFKETLHLTKFEFDSLCGVTSLTFAGEALDMEVFVLHPEHLALTCLSTLVALDGGLLRPVVGFMRMAHCGTRKETSYDVKHTKLYIYSYIQYSCPLT